MNTCIPDDRYAHKDSAGNTIYHMTDRDASIYKVKHIDVDKNPKYKRIYND